MTFFNKKFFLSLTMAVLAVAGLVWVFIKINRQAYDLRQSLNQIKSRVIFAEKERKSVRSAIVVIRERRGDLARLNQSFVKRESPVSFIEDLEDLAKKTGNFFVIDLDESKGGQSHISFRVAVDGRPASLLKYLKLVELMPYKISVDELSWQVIDSGKASHRLNILISTDTL